MKRIALFILLLIPILGVCQWVDTDMPNEINKYPLKSIYGFCQKGDDTIKKVLYYYDDQKRLIKKSDIEYAFKKIFSQKETEYFYDKFERVNRRIETTPKGTYLYKYSYIEDGLVSCIVSYKLNSTDSINNTTTYQYNEKHRLESIKSTSNPYYRKFKYNQKGQRDSMTCYYTDTYVTYAYEYDSLNRPARVYYIYKNDMITKSLQIEYLYEESPDIEKKCQNIPFIERNKFENNRLVEQWLYILDERKIPCNRQRLIYEYY